MARASGNSFNSKCYTLLKKIPRGRVTTYKNIAEALGSGAFRAVGNAMNRNENAPLIPCHRVVKSNGELGGYAGGLAKKIKLLETEGVPVSDGKIDLSRYMHRFNPLRRRS